MMMTGQSAAEAMGLPRESGKRALPRSGHGAVMAAVVVAGALVVVVSVVAAVVAGCDVVEASVDAARGKVVAGLRVFCGSQLSMEIEKPAAAAARPRKVRRVKRDCGGVWSRLSH